MRFSGRLSVEDVVSMKGREKIVMVTAYDYFTAKLVDKAGVDGILVGDSLAMVVYGYSTTLQATMQDLLRHTKAVVNAKPRSLVIADMPFMTYEVCRKDALKNSSKLVKIGADAVKLEGGVEIIDKVEAIVKAGIPVMGHVGLTPQRVLKLGGYKLMGKTAEIGEKILEDAKALEEAGVFSIVIEFTVTEVAKEVTEKLKIPTICIGSGPNCDGQILVIHDILGLSEYTPFFAKKYINLTNTITKAVKKYINDVKTGNFPKKQHYKCMNNEEYTKFKNIIKNHAKTTQHKNKNTKV